MTYTSERKKETGPAERESEWGWKKKSDSEKIVTQKTRADNGNDREVSLLSLLLLLFAIGMQ